MDCCHNMLELIGEDAAREGLVKTPERVARAILDTTAGYREDPHAILRGAMFKESLTLQASEANEEAQREAAKKWVKEHEVKNE